MIERSYGRIINIASMGSLLALYEVAAYCACKAGVASLTKSLAIEWARHGLCVNAIAPGYFRTPLSETLLMGTPRGEEVLTRAPTSWGSNVSRIRRCQLRDRHSAGGGWLLSCEWCKSMTSA
jgi:NAD(P)-dependent dehydrogenase (short-subunit alcohol dehydrogenase family)